MSRALLGRLKALERSRTEGRLRVVIQPAGLEGDALAAWEAANLSERQDDGLTVVIRRFGEEA